MLHFLHIPKTAGTTLTKFLETKFPSEQICPYKRWKELLLNPLSTHSQYALVRGHFGYGIHNIFPNMSHITLLRNPFDHTISWYEHLMRSVIKKKNPRTTKIFSGQERLLDVLQDPIQKMLFSNPQLRLIALDVHIPILLKLIKETKHKDIPYDLSAFSSSNITLDSLIPDLNVSYKSLIDLLCPDVILNDFVNFPSTQFLIPKIDDELLLSVAKKRLESFSFFGLVEFMDKTMELLYHKFQWKYDIDITREKIGWHKVDRNNLPSKTIKLIKNITKLDAELYKYAEELFHIRYRDFKEETKT